jgi:uncharacterized membrane protein
MTPFGAPVTACRGQTLLEIARHPGYKGGGASGGKSPIRSRDLGRKGGPLETPQTPGPDQSTTVANKREVVDTSHYLIDKRRLEFLFDGVFAIAMTILVLELKVPELADRHSTSELLRDLGHHIPTFVSYLLSFTMLGLLWFNHHQLFRHYERITKMAFALHLVLMASAAFFPFCAALLGRYPTNPVSMIFYVGCILVFHWSIILQWLLGEKQGAFGPNPDRELIRVFRRRNLRAGFVTIFLFVIYLSRLLG